MPEYGLIVREAYEAQFAGRARQRCGQGINVVNSVYFGMVQNQCVVGSIERIGYLKLSVSGKLVEQIKAENHQIKQEAPLYGEVRVCGRIEWAYARCLELVSFIIAWHKGRHHKFIITETRYHLMPEACILIF
jgi:hypothetical protein